MKAESNLTVKKINAWLNRKFHTETDVSLEANCINYTVKRP